MVGLCKFSNTDYSKGKIYKIENFELNLVYYGSTTQELRSRFAQHKFRGMEGGSIASLFQTFTLPSISLIENFPTDNRYDLESRERFYIQGHKCEKYKCVNKIPCRTRKEYYYDNHAQVLESVREYYSQNKNNICEKKRVRYQIKKDELLSPVLCPCGVYTSKQHFLRHQRSNIHKKNILNI